MPSPSDPIAISVFGLDVRWYALFMLAGVVAGLFLARFLAGRIGLDPDWVLDAYFARATLRKLTEHT